MIKETNKPARRGIVGLLLRWELLGDLLSVADMWFVGIE
jgi:hypothetical protein